MKSDTKTFYEACGDFKLVLKTERPTKDIYQATLWILKKGNDLCEKGLRWLNNVLKK